MKYRKGFTVIEVIVVIVIISILVSLATVQIMRSQKVARDKERADDVRSIGIHLQDVYENGQIDGINIATGDPTVTTSVPMGYPSTRLLSGTHTNDAQTQSIIQNIRLDAKKSPFMPTTVTVPYFSITPATSTADLDNSAKTAGGVTLGTTNDRYVYQPFDANGALCNYATGLVSTGVGTSATTGKTGVSTQAVIAPRLADNCVRYNLYYYNEADDVIIKVKSAKNSSDGIY